MSTTNHLVAQLERAGISWKAYEENINGTNCPLTSTGLYAAYHNPFIYFDDIYLNPINCSNHIRPYLELAGDLTNGTSPRYCFITPNLCSALNSPAAPPPAASATAIIGSLPKFPESCPRPPIPKTALSSLPGMKELAAQRDHTARLYFITLGQRGRLSQQTRFDHASTLRTLQEIFGVRPFLYEQRTMRKSFRFV